LATGLHKLQVLFYFPLKPQLRFVVFIVEKFADCQGVFSRDDIALSRSNKGRLVLPSLFEVVFGHLLVEFESLDKVFAEESKTYLVFARGRLSSHFRLHLPLLIFENLFTPLSLETCSLL